MENKVARFDLTLSLSEGEQGLSGSLEYNSCLFDDVSIEQMLENYQVLLEALVADPEQGVWDLPLHCAQPEPVRSSEDVPAQRGRLLEEQAGEQYGLYERFALQAGRTPLSAALVSGSERLSYQELDERVGWLAEKLCEQGMRPGTPVGLALERSLTQVVGLLAVLKGGGIAVPLEAKLYDALIDEAELRLVLTSKDEAAFFQQRGLTCLCLETGTGSFSAFPVLLPTTDGALARSKGAEQLSRAFAFLPRLGNTSGGEPVGGYQSYEQVSALLDHALQQGWGSRITAGSVWSLLSSPHFVYELFLPWLAGGTAYLVPDERRLAEYGEWLDDQQITCAYIPALLLPAVLRFARAGRLSHLRLLLTQAQAYPERDLRELQNLLPESLVFNGYGTPESGMWRTLYALPSASEPRRVTPIGRPYGDDRLLLLNTYLHAVPRGVIGELYRAQTEIAPGVDTEAGALPAPAGIFASEESQLCSTGAYARLLPDGNLELVGLKEQALEVGGVRVWPLESAALLMAQPGVYQAVALVCAGIDGKSELVAYVVPEPGYEIASLQATLEQVLKGQLPVSCVPSALLLLERLPLTRHGLLDIALLPRPVAASPEQGAQRDPAISPLERELVAVWSRLLKIENIGVRDNFFDRGGHSLLLVRLHNEIQSSLKLDVSILDLFKYPTIRALAEHVQHRQQADSEGQRDQEERHRQKADQEIHEIDSRAEKQRETLLRQRALMKEKRKSYGTK